MTKAELARQICWSYRDLGTFQRRMFDNLLTVYVDHYEDFKTSPYHEALLYNHLTMTSYIVVQGLHIAACGKKPSPEAQDCLSDYDQHNGIVILRLHGAFTRAESEKIEQMIEKILADTAIQGMILNLQRLEAISSAAIAVIVLIHNLLKSQGAKLVLCGLNGKAQKIMGLSHLDEVLAIYPNEAEALASWHLH